MKEVIEKLRKQKGKEVFIKELESLNPSKEFLSKNIKYLDISGKLGFERFLGNNISQRLMLKQSNEKKNVYVTYNGVCITAESSSDKIEILPINEAIQKYSDLINSCIKKRVNTKNLDKKDILTRNAFSSGVFVYIHDNAFSETNPEVIKLYSSIGEEGVVDVSYNFILVGKNNNVEIHDEVLPVPFEEMSLSSTYSDIFVEDNAKLTYLSLQNGSENLYLLSTKDVYQKKDSKVVFIDLLLNGKSITQKVHSFLDGENSDFNLSGISLPSKDQVFETYSLINNISKRTEGRVLYKNVLLDKSKNFFDGLIKVEKGADLTNSYLEDHTILVSSDAKAESIPGLEIEADDVKASHGATIGSIDKDMLFYGESRGLTEKDSIKLIVSGFIHPILDLLSDKTLEERILSLYMSKINNGNN